jgi:putative ABC transport system substrate-binding protein
MPVIGFLSGVSAGPFAHLVTAYREGLAEIGYLEGSNVEIEAPGGPGMRFFICCYF